MSINEAAAHCPSCGAEYRAGFELCSDCGVRLEPGPAPNEDAEATEVEHPRLDAWEEATRRAWGPRDDPETETHPEPVVLCRLPIQEAMLLVGRLEEEGIEARVASDDTPSFVAPVNVLKDVLVPRSRLEDAQRVRREIDAGQAQI